MNEYKLMDLICEILDIAENSTKETETVRLLAIKRRMLREKEKLEAEINTRLDETFEKIEKEAC